MAEEHATALHEQAHGERVSYRVRTGFEQPVLGQDWAGFTRAPEDSPCSGDETASLPRVDRESFGVRLHGAQPPRVDCETLEVTLYLGYELRTRYPRGVTRRLKPYMRY